MSLRTQSLSKTSQFISHVSNAVNFCFLNHPRLILSIHTLGVQLWLSITCQSIVFVHGLNPRGSKDHARSTWTHSANGNDVFWPEALLPEGLPSARIILFAYNSSVGINSSNSSVHSHAETLLNRLNLIRQQGSEKHRRLIFVAHSMGGLLVKQALVEAGIHSSIYGCIRVSTKGLVFFATPHAGGNLAGLADVAANFTSAMTGSAKNSLLKTLKQNSLLNEISKDHFRDQSGDYVVLTFIESKKMDVRIGGKRIKLRLVPQITSMVFLFPYKAQGGFANRWQCIVEADSAKLGVPGEVVLRLNRNHSDICKFSGPEDDDYELVKGNLEVMARKVQGMELTCPLCNYTSEARTSLTLGRKLDSVVQNKIKGLMDDKADVSLRNL